MKNAKEWINKNLTFIIICLSILLVGLYVSHIRSSILNHLSPKYVEMTTSIYKISNTCIRDYYTNDITSDGKIFSFIRPPEDCEATFLLDYVRQIYENHSEQESIEMARKLIKEVERLGGNATILKSAYLINKETGEIIQDCTQMIIDSKDEIIPPPEPFPPRKPPPFKFTGHVFVV